MTKERRWDNSDWPNWLHMAWNTDGEGSLSSADGEGGEELCIGTLEGVHHVSWDDWIIQGVKGEIYACKPDIFEMTYGEVNITEVDDPDSIYVVQSTIADFLGVDLSSDDKPVKSIELVLEGLKDPILRVEYYVKKEGLRKAVLSNFKLVEVKDEEEA